MRPRSNSETQKISFTSREAKNRTRDILVDVRQALEDKGYDPYVQIVGYILSGDPTYITAHNNARAAIGRLERDELLEELLMHFMEGKR
ncbi:MAG: IreB family regulatory phosphoprotein [Defluviitaleaceae bacterium]|nr:IreB family regulatory phosphoprotein [Defluviitaleaceae bacterium]